jgi:hypothetical protein
MAERWLAGKTEAAQRNTVFQCHFAKKKLAGRHVGLNPSLRSEKPAPNLLRHDSAYCTHKHNSTTNPIHKYHALISYGKSDSLTSEIEVLIGVKHTVNPRYRGPRYNGQNLAVYNCEF